MAAMLVAAGVQRAYCRGGADLSRMHEVLRHVKGMRCIGMQHGESAAFAALGEAMLTGLPAVCCGSCGGGNMQMLNALYEAGQSSVPLLALAPQLPVSAMGSGGARSCHPEYALRDAAAYCETIYSPQQAPRVLGEAMRRARAVPAAAAVVLPADVAAMPAEYDRRAGTAPTGATPAVAEPAQVDVARLAELINRSDKVVFLCGRGCAGARDLLVELARRIGAPIAYTLRGKEFMERDNPCAVGMIGLLGWGDAPAAVQVADLLVMWGTDFPYDCFLPQHGRVVQVDSSAAALGRRVALIHAVHGDVARTAALLLPLVKSGRGDEFLTRSLMRHGRAVSAMEGVLRTVDERAPIRPEYLTRLLSSYAEPDAVFAVDVGLPIIWVARYLQAFGQRRIVGALNYGTTGCALPIAIGAKAAAPSRQVIALCQGSSPGCGAAELLTLQKERLSVKVLVYNRAATAAAQSIQGGGELPPPAIDFIACAAALGLQVQRLTQVADAPAAVRRWLSARGPAVLDVALDAYARPEPPQSDLQRALEHTGNPMSEQLRRELALIRCMLYGGSYPG